MKEDDLLRLSFAQIGRLFEAYRIGEENAWRKFRLVAYESWRKGAKNAPGIDTYMPIGRLEEREVSDDDVAKMRENWEKHKKLDKRVKRKKLLRRLKNVNTRA